MFTLPTLFLIFICILLISVSLLVILAKNPVQSILFLILVYLIISVLFLWFGYEFLAVLILIIYVGAISTLFLFVVMMFDIRQTELQGKFYNYLPVGFFLGLLWFIQFFYSCYTQFFFSAVYLYHQINFLNSYWIDLIFEKTNIYLLGEVIFNYFAVYVWIVSFILLISMMGAIVLTVDFDYRGKSKIFNRFYLRICDLPKNITFWKK